MIMHIGILGGGNISQTHARAAAEIDGVRIAAVYGRNAPKVRQLADAYGARACQDLESFLDHQPMDAVLIGSPSGLHTEHGAAAARRGLHVLVEKPIDITTERADALIAACERAGVKLGVFFQDRTARDIATLKGLIDAGRLGKPILASASVKWYRPPDYYANSRWRGTRSLDGGGALMNQGIHTIDLLLWLMGDVSTVWARAITALHNVEVEDTAIAGLEFSNGAIGSLEATTAAYPGFPRRIELTWSQGTVILSNDVVISADLHEPQGDWIGRQPNDDQRARSPAVSDVSGHRRIIEDFLRAISVDGVPLCDGHQARRSVRMVEAIYESSRTGRAVALDASNEIANVSIAGT